MEGLKQDIPFPVNRLVNLISKALEELQAFRPIAALVILTRSIFGAALVGFTLMTPREPHNSPIFKP
jgi:hypothetical protein